jgi:L-fucose isomerase-like protein
VWFELCDNSQTQQPYLGKRVPEVDQYDISRDKIPQPDMDTNEYLREETERDTTTIRQSTIDAPLKLQVPLIHTTMSQTTTVQTMTAQTATGITLYNPVQSIKQAWNKGMKRNPGGGGLGGNPGRGGGGRPPSPQGPPQVPQLVPLP